MSHPVQTAIGLRRADGPPSGSLVQVPVATSNVAPSPRSVSGPSSTCAPPHTKKKPSPDANVLPQRSSELDMKRGIGGADTAVHAEAEPSMRVPSQRGSPYSLSLLRATP